ncbi:hypothetical protein FPQ18DRAFT_397143 [Pyronema domesticum]|nr:hypothetical protein FPQ18DRAFT_397143 [Pyronema domesticum]
MPGNLRKGGKDLEKKVEHECKDAISTPSTGKILSNVFLHVTVNDQRGFKFGSLLKSNSDGTNYILSLDASLEGIAIANRIMNWKETLNDIKKKLRSRFTHSDGGQWKYHHITPPKKTPRISPMPTLETSKSALSPCITTPSEVKKGQYLW